MLLRPSEIFYSQKSINSSFSNSKGIGLLVDDVCNGSVSISSIPSISVAKVGSKWFAADNRRLWVFKQLEARGKCQEIPVVVISSIPPNKMTTENGGVSVKVRGNPQVSRTPRHRSVPDFDFDQFEDFDEFDDYDQFSGMYDCDDDFDLYN